MVLPIIILAFGVAGVALATRTTLNVVSKHGGFKQALSHYRVRLTGEKAPRINLDRKEQNYSGDEEEQEQVIG